MNIGDVFYEKHTVEALSERTGEPSITKCEKVNAIEIFDGMTNGDVIKAVFPKAKTSPWNFRMWVDLDDYQSMTCDSYWWDAPYKREVKE